MEEITLPDLEMAINHWRQRRPSEGEACKLSPEVDCLATLYGWLIATKALTFPVAQLTEQQHKAFFSWCATISEAHEVESMSAVHS